MHPTTIIALIAPVAVLANVTGTTIESNVKYRSCPRTNCGVIGTYATKDSLVTVKCVTESDTDTVDGNK